MNLYRIWLYVFMYVDACIYVCRGFSTYEELYVYGLAVALDLVSDWMIVWFDLIFMSLHISCWVAVFCVHVRSGFVYGTGLTLLLYLHLFCSQLLVHFSHCCLCFICLGLLHHVVCLLVHACDVFTLAYSSLVVAIWR